MLTMIKSITNLIKLEGEYFLVCDSRICYDSLILMNSDLSEIIKNSPDFDILILNSNIELELEYLYNKWNQVYNSINYYNLNFISNSFIITKKAINSFVNNIGIYKHNRYYIYKSDFNLPYIFMFNNFNTYLYKYNFFNNQTDKKLQFKKFN